jgi:phosphatidate cytidylyltransferase
MLPYVQSLPVLTLLLYSATFILTISSLQREHIKFQMNQLCWTVVVIILTVGQIKFIFHNVMNGLIWYVMPLVLVHSSLTIVFLFFFHF